MTTEAAENFYLARQLAENRNKKWHVYNPNDLPIESLPVIYGYNAGPTPNRMFAARQIAEDGTRFPGYGCSNEAYMEGDLGIFSPYGERKELFHAKYPDGFRMAFVGLNDVEKHVGLQAALAKVQS